MDQPLEGKDYSFPKQEQITLKFWEDTDAFHEQLRRSEGKTPYIFFDGVGAPFPVFWGVAKQDLRS